MKKYLIVAMLLVCGLCGCADWDKPLITDDSIRELGKRVNWNENNGETKDFILTVRYKKEGIIFCPSFIVHPMNRDEDFPKDMEVVELNEPGLQPRE